MFIVAPRNRVCVRSRAHAAGGLGDCVRVCVGVGVCVRALWRVFNIATFPDEFRITQINRSGACKLFLT